MEVETIAKILFGGPEAGTARDGVHDDLVARLRQEHEVVYVDDAISLLLELGRKVLGKLVSSAQQEAYDVVVYDSGVFWGEAEPQRRVELFYTHVANYLKAAEAPVIVLAEQEIATQLHEVVGKAGFAQIDIPYNATRVVEELNTILEHQHIR